jgi:hypothetical protein
MTPEREWDLTSLEVDVQGMAVLLVVTAEGRGCV